jgi:protein-tyrosine phosphatase
MIDLHSHILPGLDDGARDLERSLDMARASVADGVTDMVCTPHWVPGKYENTRAAILAACAELRDRLAEARIPLTLWPGAELHVDTGIPERIRSGELLTLVDGGKYVLIELPEESLPSNLEDFFWALQLDGIKPILSHVERNPVLQRDPMRLFRWVEMGILAQITAASLVQEFSEEILDFSQELIEHRLVHILVSDAHGLKRRSPKLSAARDVVASIAGESAARRMTEDIPRRILEGKFVEPDDPLPYRSAKHGLRAYFDRFFK